MDKFNVCKFPTTSSSNSIEIKSFVLEKNKTVIEQDKKLNSNFLFLVTIGQGKFVFNNKQKIDAKYGDLIFAFENDSLHCENVQNLEYSYVAFRGPRANELFDRFRISDLNRKFSEFDYLIPFWKDCLFFSAQNNADLVAESLILYTFSKLVAKKTDQQPLVEEMTKLANLNFSNPEFSLKTLADNLNYNEKYLSHLFKQNVKTGFVDYLRSLRIKNAIFLLDTGLDSIKNVAILSGFSDPLYFSSVFKKEIGLSPKQYINKNKLDKT